MEQRKKEGGDVVLVLSAEHEELTDRPNVRPGGLMGCRDQEKSFPIDHVVDTEGARAILDETEPGTLVVFDEAQYFQPGITEHWRLAARKGVDIIVGTPSDAQMAALDGVPHDGMEMTVPCSCGNNQATRAVYQTDLVYPEHLCEQCYRNHMQTEISNLLDRVRVAEPFPGEIHTYQPFYAIEMNNWQLVRNDCPARLSVITTAANRCASVTEKLDDPVRHPSFIDLGCCSGFFADGMTEAGYRASGVDISEDFISWASQLAHIKGQAINYTQQDLHSYLTGTDKHYDVISTFATVQWVMAQEGYEAGLRCFDEIFRRADAVCIVEMGYTTEDIYSDKITDRPTEINREWMMDLMQSSGRFHSVELHPAGENGIWRDIFVGFRQAPTSARQFDDFPATNARQTSNVDDYWQDGWSGPNIRMHFQATSPISRLRLEGWRPENAAISDLEIFVSNESVLKTSVGDGLFDLESPLMISVGEYFELRISTSESFTPDGDVRNLAFVLRQLSFL